MKLKEKDSSINKVRELILGNVLIETNHSIDKLSNKTFNTINALELKVEKLELKLKKLTKRTEDIDKLNNRIMKAFSFKGEISNQT